MSVDQIPGTANGAVPDVVDQPRHDKGSWLNGATDLETDELFVPGVNDHVKVSGLSAGQLASIQDRCLSMKGDVAKIDTQQMAALKFAAGVIEPKFTEQEANVISHRFGPSFSLVVGVIDGLSKASEEDIAKAMKRFRPRR